MIAKTALRIFSALCLTFLGIGTNAQSISPAAPALTKPAAASPKVAANYGKLPLSFEPNMGQTSKAVQWLARGPAYTLFLSGHDAVLEMNKITPVKPGKVEQPKISSLALRMNLVGANTVERASGEEPLPGKANYFTGKDTSKWQRDVPMYGKVRLQGVYAGIDLTYYGRQGQLEYDFVVAPGADASVIRMNFDGAKAKLAANGDLVLPVTGTGTEVRFNKPVVYQMKDGARQPVEGSFAIAKNQQVSFKLGAYDHSRELVIDPTLLFLGILGTGSDGTLPNGMTVDSLGEIIITGYTRDIDFPVTAGALQTQCQTYSAAAKAAGLVRCGPGAQTSAFVTKISADGKSLVYSTYLHGLSGEESGQSVATDAAGDAYILGTTSSVDFPITADAYQTDCLPAYEVTSPTTLGPIVSYCSSAQANSLFIAKLNPAGSAILYATFFGGSYAVTPAAIALDSSNNIYFASSLQAASASQYYPNSENLPFPVTASAYQRYGVDSGFGLGAATLSELSANGHTLLYSTLMGTLSTDYLSGSTTPYALAVGPNGIAYIGGETSSADFPVTPGVVKGSCVASTGNSAACARYTAFLSAFDTSKSGDASLAYSTYIGGAEIAGANEVEQQVQGLAVDSSNNIYVTGFTQAIDYPTTKGAYQTTCTPASGLCQVAFLSKINPTGTAYVWSTLYGADNAGPLSANGEAVALDTKGRVYLYGQSRFGGGDFVNPIEPYYGADKLFIATFSADGTQLEFGTHIGNAAPTENENDEPIPSNGFLVDSTGNMYFVGYTADGGALVGTHGTYANTAVGGSDRAFFGKISPVLEPSTTALTITPSTTAAGQSVTFTVTVAGTSQTTPMPTGTVTLTNGSTTPPTELGTITLDAGGSGTYSTSSLTAATYSVTAAYSGDGEYDLSTSAAAKLTITTPPIAVSTTTTLAASAIGVVAGTTITFTGTVKSSGTQVPTGTITFKDGTTTLGTGAVGATGAATYATGALAVGTHSITASYGGDTNNVASTSSAVNVTITTPAAGFSLTLSPASASVAEGSSATTTISVAPSNGFSSATTLSCSGLPINATCAFSPASVTPSGAAITSTLTIATGVATTASLEKQRDTRSGGSVLAKLSLAGSGALLAVLFWPSFFNRKRKTTWLRIAGVVFLATIVMQTLSGCGGGSSSGSGNQTPSGTSSITVMATSGSLMQTTTFKLTVQ